MTLGLVGRKVGMTRIFAEDGTTVPGVARVAKAATPNQPANRPAP